MIVAPIRKKLLFYLFCLSSVNKFSLALKNKEHSEFLANVINPSVKIRGGTKPLFLQDSVKFQVKTSNCQIQRKLKMKLLDKLMTKWINGAHCINNVFLNFIFWVKYQMFLGKQIQISSHWC